jgi:hypothetical protein
MSEANVGTIENVTVVSTVRVGRDFAGQYVLLSIPRENDKATVIAFSPEEAELVIRHMLDELRIIHDLRAATN